MENYANYYLRIVLKFFIHAYNGVSIAWIKPVSITDYQLGTFQLPFIIMSVYYIKDQTQIHFKLFKLVEQSLIFHSFHSKHTTTREPCQREFSKHYKIYTFVTVHYCWSTVNVYVMPVHETVCVFINSQLAKSSEAYKSTFTSDLEAGS